jgi:hypothetical protein
VKTLITAIIIAGAVGFGVVACDDTPPDSGLPALDVSAMTAEECEAVRRLALKQGVSQVEVDRRVKCPRR